MTQPSFMTTQSFLGKKNQIYDLKYNLTLKSLFVSAKMKIN